LVKWLGYRLNGKGIVVRFLAGASYFSLVKVLRPAVGLTQPRMVRIFGCYVRGGGGERSGLGMELTAYVTLMRMLRICGVIHPSYPPSPTQS